MKQMEVFEKTIGENTFYIKPFPAFVAANISGELAALLTPFVSSIAAIVGKSGRDSIMDVDIEDAIPILTNSFSSLSGDKCERLIKRLLIDHKNISVESDITDRQVSLLTLDIANEVFCGDVQDMYILCYEVIKLNFKGFFSKIGDRFGGLIALAQKTAPTISSMEN